MIGTDLSALRGVVAGSVAAPGEPEYDRLSQAWNTTARQRPALVVAPTGAEGVASAVRFAADRGLRVAVQATGHGAAGVVGGDVVLINLRGLDRVQVDPEGSTAMVGAGTTWGALALAAEQAGLAGLAGTSPGVGVAGYTLHGGAGWLARAHGLASAALLAVDYVDASGEPHRADELQDPEALWAFRGGAGVGIATRVELRLWPHPRLYAGSRQWPLDQADRILERWLEWAETAPPSITSMAWAFQVPNGPAGIGLGACGSDPDADRVRIEELLAGLPEPAQDTFALRSPSQLGEILPGPPMPVPSRGDGRLLSSLDAATATEILRASGIGTCGPLVGVELRHLGARAGEPDVSGALTALPGRFLVDASAMARDPEAAQAADAAFRRMAEAAGPADLGRSVAGFRGGQSDAPGALDPETCARLQSLRRQRDPEDRFHRPRNLI